MRKAVLVLVALSLAVPTPASAVQHHRPLRCFYPHKAQTPPPRLMVKVISCWYNTIKGIPISKAKMVCIARKESSLYPYAKNGNNLGLFQLSWFYNTWNRIKRWFRKGVRRATALNGRLNALVTAVAMKHMSLSTIRGQWTTADDCGI